MVNSRQRGFVIPLGLVLLLGLSITAIGISSTGFVQEKMAGIDKVMTDDFLSAETLVKEQEIAFAALDDISSIQDDLLDPMCGIKEITGSATGVTIKTAYYNPPPQEYNWGDGTDRWVLICHYINDNQQVELTINENGLNGHMFPSGQSGNHQDDYLGPCLEDGTLTLPDDPWKTCWDKFGTVAKRLSWIQTWDN